MKNSSSTSIQKISNLVTILAILLAVLAAGFYLYRQLSKPKLEPVFTDYAEGTFGRTGIYEFNTVIAAKAIALQSDHKIVVAGFGSGASFFDFAVFRLTAEGLPDPTFGDKGTTLSDFGGDEQANAVAIQTDGKILLAGTVSSDQGIATFGVARYNTAGQLDTAFGTQGLVTFAFGSAGDSAQAMVLQPDGKIIVAGHSRQKSNRDFAVIRLLADGTPDPTFGTNGLVTTAVGAAHDEAYAVGLQPDGKIVVAGYSAQGSNFDFAVVRYLPDGKVDAGFGNAGKATATFGSSSNYAYALAIMPDGGILVGGSAGNRANYDFAMAQFKADGKGLVTSFGNSGKVVVPMAAGDDTIYAMALQPNAKIMAVGSAGFGDHPNNIAIGKFMPDGTLDPLFGYKGKAMMSEKSLVAYSVALQPNGKLVIAGSRVDVRKGNVGVFVARYRHDGSLDKP